MAGLRNLLILLVATSFVSSAVAVIDVELDAGDVAVAVGNGETNADPQMDSFVNYWMAEAEAKSQSFQSDSTVGTSAAAPRGQTIIVDASGKGDYRKVQQAVNSIPKGNKKRIIIYIRDGIYREKILIPKEKPFIYFKCQSRNAVMTWGDTAAEAGGTSLSASTAIESEGFIASDCTFANSAPPPAGGAVGRQAVALRIQGDKGAFYRCSFLGAQDTLYDKEGRHYFLSCYIRGSIDWIFGNGQSFYQSCDIRSIADKNSGSIAAQKRDGNSKTGFVFYQCRISGSGSIFLGRAWGTHSRIVFIRCSMANMIRPIGWQDWNEPKRQKTVFYAEYMCTGPGANRMGRAKWSRVLTALEAKPFSSPESWIDSKSWIEPRM